MAQIEYDSKVLLSFSYANFACLKASYGEVAGVYVYVCSSVIFPALKSNEMVLRIHVSKIKRPKKFAFVLG